MTIREDKTNTDSVETSMPLIVEPHPANYTGFPFVTLIQYRKNPLLAIVDNVDDEVVRAYILDLCGPERVNEELIVTAAMEWYKSGANTHPLSIEFSRLGMTPMTSKIYRALSIEFVSRIIGPIQRFPMTNIKSIKRRRRKPIAVGVEIHTE